MRTRKPDHAALSALDSATALDAAHRLAAVARGAGLREWLCEALALMAQLDGAAAADAARAEALTLARAQGFGWLITRLDGAA